MIQEVPVFQLIVELSDFKWQKIQYNFTDSQQIDVTYYAPKKTYIMLFTSPTIVTSYAKA